MEWIQQKTTTSNSITKGSHGNHNYSNYRFVVSVHIPIRKEKMKDHIPKEIESNIHSFKVYGKTILIDYAKEEIIFPENISQDEMENIACYLVEEGFTDPRE